MKPTKDLRAAMEPIIEKAHAAQEQYKNTKAIVPDHLMPYYGYEMMLAYVLMHGQPKTDRTGTGTWGIHGYQLRFNLSKGFPLVTTKRVHTLSIIYENLWFLTGDTNIQFLKENNVTIWDEWADENGDLGPVYGKQWRNWHRLTVNADGKIVEASYDQIDILIKTLKENPQSRRMIVNSWNVADLDKMALAPCHTLFQFHTALLSLDARRKVAARKLDLDTSDMGDDEMDHHEIPQYQLDLELYQRSADIFLGVPFNIASYSMLLLMVAQVVNMEPGEFIHIFGDLHIYQNHLDQVVKQLTRMPYAYPTMRLNPEIKDIFGFDYPDFTLENYQHHPGIKAPVAVGISLLKSKICALVLYQGLFVKRGRQYY